MSKILIDRSVVEQALEALKYERDANNPLDWHHDKTMNALRAALEQPDHSEQRLDMVPQVEQEPVAICEYCENERPVIHAPQPAEQEPVAWANINKHGDITHTSNKKMPWAKTPIYLHPQPPRQPLTEMEIVELRQLTPGTLDVQFVLFARAIERAHGIGS